jgi:branched-chain amino acid transport system permease protein
MQEILNATVLGSIYLLFALGMSLAWGTIGILNFAHGAVFMFSAFAAHLISEHARLPMIAYIVVSGAVGAVLSVLIQLLAFAPIQRRAADHQAAETQILIGGIGVASIPVAVAAYVTKSGQFGFDVADQNPVLTVFGLRLTLIGAAILVCALVISGAIAVWLRRSRTGLALRAIGVDPESARLMGIHEPRLAVATMAIGGLLAGLAGALLTVHLVAISPTTGDDFLVKAFAATVLGGVGSTLGVVVGSFSLAFVETVVILAGYGSWANAVAFLLIFMVLLVRPQGLFGRKEVKRA